ncbi:MAG: hypothetical protein H0V05_02640 [Euzebyaceae bacterium]|nr:hypothetical protein [Euzebyaceae bacterium]
MPTQLLPRKPVASADREWRCRRCDKLLGLVLADRLHLRFARQHEYHAALPASCTCRSCGALNELNHTTPPRAA